MNFPELQPAPPVGFNLTFMCPEGEVCLQKHNLQNTNTNTKTFICPEGEVCLQKHKAQNPNANSWANENIISAGNSKFINKKVRLMAISYFSYLFEGL